MTKTKLLTIFVVCLFVLNIFLVSNAYLSDRHGYTNARNPRPGSKRYVMEALDFNQEQVKKYTYFIRSHKKVYELKQKEFKRLKQTLYGLLISEDFSQKDSLIVQMGNIQAEIEELRFKHLLDVKSICRKDQLAKFEAVSKKLVVIRPERSGSSE